MNRPHFVNLVLSCLVVDAAMIVALPILGYTSIFAMILGVPLVLAAGAIDALSWLRTNQSNECRWTALAHAMGGVSLPFLLVALVLNCLKDYQQGDIWQIIFELYLFIFMFRLLGSALLNCLVAPLTFFLGRSPNAKISSVSAFVNSALGLHLYNRYMQPEVFDHLVTKLMHQNHSGAYPMLTLLAAISFLGGLVWGAAVQWGARELKG